MNIDPQQANLIVVGAVVAIVVAGVLAIAMKRSKTIGERLLVFARDAGWQNGQRMRALFAGVRGTWNGFEVSVRRVPRQKAIPERVVLRVRVQVPARLAVSKRSGGFRGGRPLALFGPPVVELRDGGGREFWIRGDEITLAERLFASGVVTALLDRNLVSRFDGVTLAGDALQILRATAGGGAQFGGTSLDQLVQTAHEEWELAKAVVETLALRP